MPFEIPTLSTAHPLNLQGSKYFWGQRLRATCGGGHTEPRRGIHAPREILALLYRTLKEQIKSFHALVTALQ